jgi:hypothetical protein
MEASVPPPESSETAESGDRPLLSDDLTPKSVEVGDMLADVLALEREQALVDLQSWKVALTALLGELILHEMPIMKLATYVDKVQSDMQHELQFGTPLRHPGALAAAAELVGKIEHSAEWRRASWDNDRKKRLGLVDPTPPPASGKKTRGKT